MFKPFLPMWLIVIWGGFALWLSLSGYRHLRGLVAGRCLAMLCALRGLGLLAFTLLLLRPCHLRSIPDAAAFKTAVLADCSASMRVEDTDGSPRISLVPRAVAAIREGGDKYGRKTDLLGFTGKTFPVSASPDVVSGASGIGDALARLMADEGFAEYGAVILVSDGNWNAGVSPMEVAKRYAEAGIPVSCVGCGAERWPGDVAIEATAPASTGRRGEKMTLDFRIRNTFNRPVDGKVSLHSAGGETESREVMLPPQSSGTVVSFEVIAYQSGVHTWRAEISAPDDDRIPETDVAYAAAHVGEPEKFRIAYLSGALDWEFGLMKTALAGGGQFELSAMIMTGAGTFYRLGAFDVDPAPPFPAGLDGLGMYHALIVHVSALPLMGAEGIAALHGFVERRGGGLLVVGGGAIPPSLKGLLPVVSLVDGALPGKRWLEVDGDNVFPQGTAPSLTGAPGPHLPADFPAARARDLKKAARPAMSLKEGDGTVLAVQNYGSGRVAWMSFQGSWRWRLLGGGGRSRHSAFWEHLAVWLASSSKERLNIPWRGTVAAPGEQFRLSASLLTSDYQPAHGAAVTALITAPDGRTEELQMLPSIERSGLFETLFTPRHPGEYRAAVSADFSDGERLVGDAFFLASPGGSEMADPGYRGEVLKDVARISGGSFFDAASIGRLASGVPIFREVPRRTIESHPLESRGFIALLLAVVAGEWYARRRIGLK